MNELHADYLVRDRLAQARANAALGALLSTQRAERYRAVRERIGRVFIRIGAALLDERPGYRASV